MSEMTENMRQYLTVKAEQNRLTDELTLNLSTVSKLITRRQQELIPENFVAWATQLTNLTNKALRNYVNSLTTLLDQLETDDG